MQKSELLQIELASLESKLIELGLWQNNEPTIEALQSELPFALDTMHPHEWLQWIFIPKMQMLIDTKADLPQEISIVAYLEENITLEYDLQPIINVMQNIENLLVK